MPYDFRNGVAESDANDAELSWLCVSELCRLLSSIRRGTENIFHGLHVILELMYQSLAI